MSNRWLACAVLLAGGLAAYSPPASAIKVTRDAAPPAVAPKAKAQPERPPPHLAALPAAQIVDKAVAAAGGLQAWRSVHTLSVHGKLDAGGKTDTFLPFTMELKRGLKQRMALQFAGQEALQVFDGEHGWTYRPYLGRTAAEPFTADEKAKSVSQDELDGPLVDYAAKGSKVENDGTDWVDGKASYRLKLTTQTGLVRHVWIDSATFLENKIEGPQRRVDGKMRPVWTYMRDYKKVDGLMIPFTTETVVQGITTGHKIVLDSVNVNPALEDSRFGKPEIKVAAQTHPAMVPVANSSGKDAKAAKGVKR